MSKKRKNNTAEAIKLLAKEIHELKKNEPSTAGGSVAFTKLTIDLSTIRTYHLSIKSAVTSVNVEFPESLKGGEGLHPL